MICIPIGIDLPPSPVGMTIAGTPSSDQMVQKLGSPVVSRESGASPAAGGSYGVELSLRF